MTLNQHWRFFDRTHVRVLMVVNSWFFFARETFRKSSPSESGEFSTSFFRGEWMNFSHFPHNSCTLPVHYYCSTLKSNIVIWHYTILYLKYHREIVNSFVIHLVPVKLYSWSIMWIYCYYIQIFMRSFTPVDLAMISTHSMALLKIKCYLLLFMVV